MLHLFAQGLKRKKQKFLVCGFVASLHVLISVLVTTQ